MTLSMIDTERLSLAAALKLWREHGGSTFGPRVEHVSMKESDFLGFCRALHSQGEAGEPWNGIKSAPTLDRIFVAGWQKPSGRVAGYWWVHEDVTDENGRPMDHPDALLWQSLPARPTAAAPKPKDTPSHD